jgi:hypothetical protein
MSRRRKPKATTQDYQPPRRASRNTGAEYPKLDIKISLHRDGKVEVDPAYNNAAIAHLDVLYEAAERDDYDPEWTDDHKIAFYVYDLMDGFLQQWDTPISQDEVDTPVSEVPTMQESPVVDRYDIADMEPVQERATNDRPIRRRRS